MKKFLSVAVTLSLLLPSAAFAAATRSSSSAGRPRVLHAPPKKPIPSKVQLRRQIRSLRLRPVSPSSIAASNRYVLYKEGVIGNGETSVLFFHAAWCPVCRAGNNTLNGWYPSDKLLAAYKVDYDDAVGLKSTYGVTCQHTFVKIDGKGDKIGILQSPTDDSLKAFLLK